MRLIKLIFVFCHILSKITVSGNVGDISSYTSPLKVFDYMKLGKLIISSNIPVLKEFYLIIEIAY